MILRKLSRFRARSLSFAAFAFDIGAVACAWMIAYAIRFNGVPPPSYLQTALLSLWWVIPTHAVMFRIFGLYRGMWVFASLPDLVRISKAVLTAAVLTVVGSAMVQPSTPIPRSVLLLSPILLFVLMGGTRALYRYAKEFHRYGGLVAQGKPVLVLGAGEAGASLVRELSRSPQWRLVGLLDDNVGKLGREIHGYKVLGRISQLQSVAEAHRCSHAIIAIPSAPAEIHRRIATICVRASVRALVLPAFTPLTQEQPFLMRVRQIDLEDLLGRDEVSIDTPHIAAMLKGRVVMVTGAGGSIGSELCRQILKFGPAQLVAYDISEYGTYSLLEELRAQYPHVDIVPIVGDVKDSLLLEQTMQRYAPYIVYHAAAYKHVPLMEEQNAWQAVRNNVLGTYRVANAAIQHGVHRFVLISTDKAVNPTNVMGASKRLAEMLCQALQQGTGTTQFAMVRFGNVLGSAGSVIPKFQKQIAGGGPVTVTHPEIIRYFMTIPEAAQLVLQASSMGDGGEIFLLDMGEPVRIADLARDLIRLYGFVEDQIKIVFTGLRPGEKLFEELLADDETTCQTPHPKLRIARARSESLELIDEVMPWLLQRRIPGDDEVRRDLRRWVPEYAPPKKPPLQIVATPVVLRPNGTDS